MICIVIYQNQESVLQLDGAARMCSLEILSQG